MENRLFHVHGDNIVECERVFSLIGHAHGDRYSITGPVGGPATPRFSLQCEKEKLEFVFFPGFGRWEEDILKYVTGVSGTLREAADAIVTRVHGTKEVPLAAIEYCSALAAGNNAWQRCGRAYSFAKAGIPYFYLTDIGGYELDGERALKARRYPNVAVPFSYVALSLRSEVVALPVYECNPSADAEFRQHFAPALSDSLLERILFALLHEQPIDDMVKRLEDKTIRFVQLLQMRPDLQRASNDAFDAATAYAELCRGSSLAQVLTKTSAPWRKSITIPITPTATKFLELGSQYGRGITRASLPLTFIPQRHRAKWAENVSQLYKDLRPDLSTWINRCDDLVIAWIAGFKPRGDDSRPDRGLVPLARMLFGEEIDLLSFVYGPGKPEMWRVLHNDPQRLMQRNGLWEAVLTLSSAVIVDSPTNAKLTQRGYIRSHWSADSAPGTPSVSVVSEKPVSYGENDVDSVLHNVMRHLMSAVCFEGMCNPPGGDWSGVSILNNDRSTEYRWLTLPRVSGANTKRPDHVFQLFPVRAHTLLLTVESKEAPESVELGIGPRLERYLKNLFSTSPNVSRSHPGGEWGPYRGGKVTAPATIATGIAFLGDETRRITDALCRSKADLALGLHFAAGGKSCDISAMAATETGRAIVRIMAESLKSEARAYRFTVLPGRQ